MTPHELLKAIQKQATINQLTGILLKCSIGALFWFLVYLAVKGTWVVWACYVFGGLNSLAVALAVLGLLLV
jgi:predicted small integral membrane protein